MSEEVELFEIFDWTTPDKEGNINVPDHLDKLVNSIGFQFRFVSLSGKNELEAICDTAFIAQKFFRAYHENKKINAANDAIKKLYEDLSNELKTLAKLEYSEPFLNGYEAALWDFKIIAKDTFQIELDEINLYPL